MPVRIRATYPPEPSAVAAARRDVQDSVEAAGLAGAAPVVCLLTSELVTNAVRHARTPLAVTVEWDGARLRVEVEDHDDALPVQRVQPREEPGGLGLLIVSEMASRWGYERSHHRGGKIVWFELATSGVDVASRAVAS